MKKYRFFYFLILILIIFLGILSRKIDLVPLYIGDFLYAVMIYVLMRILFIRKKALFIIMSSLLLCYSIEFFQLCQADWIIAFRKTLFGRYVLGQEFLWIDIWAYTSGIFFIFFIEIGFHYKPPNQKSL